MKAMFTDASSTTGIHSGHVEHMELDLTEEELARIKARAAKAVTMDCDSAKTTPAEYDQFLHPDPVVSYDDFLRGKG